MWSRNWTKIAIGLGLLVLAVFTISKFEQVIQLTSNLQSSSTVITNPGKNNLDQNGSNNNNNNVNQDKSLLHGNATSSNGHSSELLNAAIVSLVRNENLEGIRRTIRQVEDRFNKNYGYRYILLNDVPFTDHFKKRVQAIVNRPIEFGLLDKESWGYSPYVEEEIVKQKLKENKDKYIYGESLSYRFMCRFQSGFIHKHPLLKDLDFYWRIEPDVDYYCEMPYDPFKLMKDNKYKYGFNIAPPEKSETVKTLWKTTREWIKDNIDLLPEKSFASLILNEKNEYNMCHFWSNFEIVDLSLYRSPAYESYFQHLDRAGGFFYERWGDAPIHSIAAALFLTKDQIHWYEDVGYHHPGYEHCPIPEELNNKCLCNVDKSFTKNSHCQRMYKEQKDITRDELLKRLNII
ncbi:alpha-1,2-mannosyltransferase ktr1 [Mycoemilia scoparia]|uniref:Alpha-1,2-mannosyltransferase ktr1 n=1 Tax=Mycoemilia scoparia TaxID=417184 RepID=A0A9W8A2G0_9FUNG|nr:alpha-1,2-mannosyltransferase ktr1 [Mycoemilia scoparia]